MERTRFMRVAVNVEQLLYRAPGGIGRYTAKLVTLLGVVAPDVTVVPFTARHGADEAAEAYQAFGLADTAVALPVRLPLPRPVLYDAWHTVGLPHLGWMSQTLGSCRLIHAPSVAVPPKGRARLVVTVHDAAPLLYPEAFTGRGRRFHERGLKAAARRADLVIAVSRAAAQEIVEQTTISAERVRVVPNGVDAVELTPDEVAAAVAGRGLADAPYVLWVGSLEPRKNLGVLVEAFAQAVEQAAQPHRLVLAGPSGWRDDGLVPPRLRARLADRLRLLGPVGQRELAALYTGADLMAFPSRHEGFGLPVLEAMAQGTPVICADIPALREVAGGAATLVPPDDVAGWARAIAAALGEGAGAPERARMVTAGRRRAADLTWEKTVRATRDVYDEALA
jgi:glycosyltransferase involved in cell wall biosynthesis